MLKIERVVAAALAGVVMSTVAAQDAVQWRVEDGGNGHWYSARRFAAKEDPGGIDRWYVARNHCESIGGHMATITSAAESSFVWMNIVPLIPPVAGNGRGPNLGGVKVGRSWEWITGEPWSYSDFCPAEPLLATGNYCRSGDLRARAGMTITEGQATPS